MPSTKTPSRGPRERARKKRAANQLRKVDHHQARIEELESALQNIQELVLGEEDSQIHLAIKIYRITKQALRAQ